MFEIKYYKSNLRDFYQWHNDISGTILYKMTILSCSVEILCLTKQSLLAGPDIVTALAKRHTLFISNCGPGGRGSLFVNSILTENFEGPTF